MKQVYPVKVNLFNRPQVCGKARAGVKNLTVLEALAQLEHEAGKLVKHARWAGFRSPINELRRPLLEIRLARKRENEIMKALSQ